MKSVVIGTLAQEHQILVQMIIACQIALQSLLVVALQPPHVAVLQSQYARAQHARLAQLLSTLLATRPPLPLVIPRQRKPPTLVRRLLHITHQSQPAAPLTHVPAPLLQLMDTTPR